MEPVLFILLITVAGSSGFGMLRQCELSRCDDTLNPQDFRNLLRNFPPDEEELREICPPLLEAIHCFSSVIQECTGESIGELEKSDNETVAQLMSMIQSVMSLMREVCDGESQFGKDFRDSAPCIKKILSDGYEDCRSEGFRLYEAFRNPEGFDFEDMEEDEMRHLINRMVAETRCLRASYEMACNLKDTEKTCGSVAKDVLLQVVKRGKMLKMGICTEEDLLTLRGQFLDFLEEQGEHRAFFANAFEFRKRRK